MRERFTEKKSKVSYFSFSSRNISMKETRERSKEIEIERETKRERE